MERDQDVSRLDWWPEDKAGACPDPEILAAFVDGRLDSGERSRIARHLAGCTRCYEAFTGTLEALPEKVVASSASATRIWLPIAAAVACLAVGFVWLRARSPLPGPGRYLSSVMGVAVATDVEPWPVVVFRGTPEDAASGSAFEIGVLLVDAQTLAARGDAAAARPRFLRLAQVLERAGFLEREADLCREAGEASEETIRGYGTRIAPLADALADRFDRRDLVQGAWAEAGRLAALGRERPFFDDSRQRAILRSWSGPREVGPREARALAQVADRWPQGESAPEWPRLAEAFSEILETHVR